MIEVELKFEIPPETRGSLQEKLDELPTVRWLGQINNSDRYYDTTSFDCLQQAVFIRVRNRSRLELKFHDLADPAHTHSTERAFPLTSEPPEVKEMNRLCARFIQGWHEADSVDEAICINDLREFVRIANRRTRFAYENLTLCLDDVEGLGNFLEIEAACQEQAEIDEALAKLHGFVSELAFPALQPVRTGYVEQWLRLYRPQVYQLRKESL